MRDAHRRVDVVARPGVHALVTDEDGDLAFDHVERLVGVAMDIIGVAAPRRRGMRSWIMGHADHTAADLIV